MKYVVSLILAVFAWSAHAQYTSVDAFPSLPNFSSPLAIENAGDGSNRLFVVEQKGKIYVIENSPTVSTRKLFLDLSDIVSQGGGEMGLLGLAFHPDYKNNGYFYVNYTSSIGFPRTTSVTARYKVSASNPDSAVHSSELRLFTVQQPYDNHNGGCIKFGPDGYLYISFGDGGAGGDPQNRAQNLDSLFGKILRIDVDNPSDGKNYGIPASNPYASSPNANRKMIFAYGLRNVWRMTFDVKDGRLWAGDVGQGKWEEIDIIESGKNYGWKVLEGTHCYSPSTGCDTTGKVMPVLEYEHLNGNVSITGGYVYRGEKLLGLYGRYIYADYATGNTWSFDITNPKGTNTLLQAPTQTISSFGVDEANELYACRYTGKRIFKFVPTNPLSAPRLTAPKNDSMNAPTTVKLTWDAISGAQYYEVTIADDASFTQGIRDTSTTLTSLTLNFAPGTKHYWKVKAWNNITVSDWSESRTFTIGGAGVLAAPTLIAPKNDSVEAPITMTLRWNAVSGATSYEVMTAIDPGFTQVVRDTTVTGTSVTMMFASGTMHFWKVRAKNATLTSDWSEMRTFTVRLLSNIPSAPKLITPINGAVLTDPFSLIWTKSPATATYLVELAYDLNFTSSILSDTTYSINDTTLLLPVAPILPPDTVIYWRVRACNSDGECSPWSEVEDFIYVLNTSVDRSPELERQISIYPNPTTGSFAISSESELIKYIRIYDAKGTPLKFTPEMSKILLHKRNVTLLEPAAGTYFVEIELETGAKVVKKIVVE